LSLAVLVFAFWQGEISMIGGVGNKVTSASIISGALMMALDLLLLIHSSYFVMPVQALTAAAVNFGSQLKILEAAKHFRVRPDLVHEFEEAENRDVRRSSSCASAWRSFVGFWANSCTFFEP
jgi:hypothetical protein